MNHKRGVTNIVICNGRGGKEEQFEVLTTSLSVARGDAKVTMLTTDATMPSVCTATLCSITLTSSKTEVRKEIATGRDRNRNLIGAALKPYAAFHIPASNQNDRIFTRPDWSDIEKEDEAVDPF